MSAADLALISAGLFLLVGMLTGVWKYRHMMASDEATAPVYVDICHRTALMYAFACIVLQQLALRSAWSATVDFWATLLPIIYFASAVATYALHGFLQDTDNQLRRPHTLGSGTLPGWMIRAYMWGLIAAEIGGLLVLIAGVVRGL